MFFNFYFMNNTDEWKNITRFEVIDSAGRAFFASGYPGFASMQLQDNNRTLKIFLNNKYETNKEQPYITRS